jgi:hypothetical protein
MELYVCMYIRLKIVFDQDKNHHDRESNSYKI